MYKSSDNSEGYSALIKVSLISYCTRFRLLLIIANDVIISLNDNDFNLRARNSYEGID